MNGIECWFFVAGRYTEGQRFGRHIDESVNLRDGSKTYYTLLIYLSGKGSAKDSSGQGLVGGETVFYDQRSGVVAEVLPGSKILISLIKSPQVYVIVSSKKFFHGELLLLVIKWFLSYACFFTRAFGRKVDYMHCHPVSGLDWNNYAQENVSDMESVMHMTAIRVFLAVQNFM